MQLSEYNIGILKDILDLLTHIPNTRFTSKRNILSGASVGQHIRHIIDFYTELENGMRNSTVCYDDRKRTLLIETNSRYAALQLRHTIDFLRSLKKDRPLRLKVNYARDKEGRDAALLLKTSLQRELAFTLDHAIHHLAIIKMALSEDAITLNQEFGVAPSTLRYRKQCAQ